MIGLFFLAVIFPVGFVLLAIIGAIMSAFA